MAQRPALRAYLERGPEGVSVDSARAALIPGGSPGPTSAFAELLGADGTPILSSPDAPDGDPVAREALVALARGEDAPATGPLAAIGPGVFVPNLAPIRALGQEEILGWVMLWLRVDDDEGTREALSGLIGAQSTFYLTDVRGEVWTDLAARTEPLPVRIDAATSAAVTYRTAGGGQVGAAGVVANTPWRTFVAFPLDDVLGPARRTVRRLAFIGVLLILGGLLGAFALSSGITRPIKALVEATRALGAGNYEQRVQEPHAEELRSLARTFNDMAGKIRDSHQELERRAYESEESESRLRATQERLERVVASTNAVIYERNVTTREGSLSWISDNVHRVLGYSAEIAKAPGWWRANVHTEDLPALEEWVGVPRPGRSSRTYRFRDAEGAYRWVTDERRCIADAEGEVTAVVGAFLDVTEQHTLEEQLRQAQKLEAVGRLAGGIAHDFNNILTVILAETEDALATLPEAPATVRASLDAVLASATSAAMLTRQLLTFSRRELVHVQPVDPNDVVRSLHSMLRRLVGEDLALDLELAGDLGSVLADRGHLEQVVANLVVNARDASKPGGAIVIRTENVDLDGAYARSHASGAGPHVAVSVSDAGMGMSEEVKAHLFEPFFTTKPMGEGTGLGLATCYTIAQRLGGHIRVYSELGLGTTVRMYLPRADARAEGDGGEASQEIPRGTEAILVVEDEEGVRNVAGRVLRGCGYTVYEAPDGERAIELLEEGLEVDLLLTDLIMPRMGGRDLAHRAETLRPRAKVLFMSGYTDDVVLRQDLAKRGIPFLQKPFSMSTLTHKVRDTLDG
jgi:PAS domain S-box-containing protein